MKKIFKLWLLIVALLLSLLLWSCNTEVSQQPIDNSEDPTSNPSVDENSTQKESEEAKYAWKSEYKISELEAAIIESKAEPLKKHEGVKDDGTFESGVSGEKMPVEYLSRADESLDGKSIKLDFSGLKDTIVVLYDATDTQEERTVVMTSSVMLVLKTNFVKVENFKEKLSEPMTVEVLSSKIIHKTDDHSYCLQYYSIFKQGGVIEELPELDYDSDVYYAFYNREEFEIFSDKMWEQIYPDEDVPVGDLFKRTYERFGVSELVFGE